MDPMLLEQIGPALIAVIVPLIVALAKAAIPHIPKLLLPIIAGALGPALDQASAAIADAMTGGDVPTSGVYAVLLGLAGVGIRELIDQFKKATADEIP
jgi:hypothetical protein